MSKQFEYLKVIEEAFPVNDIEKQGAERKLNHFGKDGWEMVSAFIYGDKGAERVWYTFKRELAPPAEV